MYVHISLAHHLLNDHIYGISKRLFIICVPMNSMDFFDIHHSDLVEFPGPLSFKKITNGVGFAPSVFMRRLSKILVMCICLGKRNHNWVHMPSMRWINYVECSHIFHGLCFDPSSNSTFPELQSCRVHKSTDQSSKYPLNRHNLEVSVSSFSDTSFLDGIVNIYFPKRYL